MAEPMQYRAAHPRRPPAHRSVSLLHSRSKRTSPLSKDQTSDSSSDSVAADSSRANSDSPSSLQPLGRGSSGESSNADRWFEKSNNDVRDNSASFADNDPPFFMRNSSSSQTPPDAQRQQRLRKQPYASNDDGNTLPIRTNLLQLHTDGSSTEEYRGVIDDLTIENKKLKRRLRNYEKLHDSHLRDEKLFEVRIHGLPPDKKRELEDTLRKFASSLGNGFPTNGYEGLLPLLNKQNVASSQTSIQNADSAYASMSASGQGSSSVPSGSGTRYQHLGPSTTSRKQHMHSNIHTYLHHIPEGLFPQSNPANMTERARKKLVVRRLEQVFVGKGAATSGHQHSEQQQDVSQMAARADRVEGEAQGQRAQQEGHREALIMDHDDEDKQDASNISPESLEHRPKSSNPQGEDVANSRTSAHGNNDQRPTRPLDLDPHRAQVPEENLKYIRHLGFSPPDLHSQKTQEDGHGWIYLNLLINMAQLHTINVTDNFVRKALTEHSSKFELSHDGRKVRWKGGRSVTRTSSSAGGSSVRTDVDTPDRDSPRKRPKLSHRESGKSGGATGLRSQHESNKLVYTPLFFHKDSTDEGDESSEEDDDSVLSPFPVPVAGDSSGMTSSGMHTTATKKRPKKREDGPIIFYNNARFCTDLSGDWKATGNSNAPPYITASEDPVGKTQRRLIGTWSEKRGPLAQAKELPEPMDLVDNPIPASMELTFPLRSPPLESGRSSGGEMKPIELEVTGIGNLQPADNFAIAVESRYAVADDESSFSKYQKQSSRRVTSRLTSILKSFNARPPLAVHRQILKTETKILDPSSMPPALSFMPFSEDSLDDDESEMGDEMSVTPDSPGALPPSAAPQPVEFHFESSDDEEEDDDDDDDDAESDSSLDLLAAAREVDPEAIREQEREYDANMAERLAEEIPAGSSAATAGGGSGFASPASGMDRETYEKAMRSVRARRGAIKRSTTTDSMKVQNPQESSSEDDDEDDGMDDVAS